MVFLLVMLVTLALFTAILIALVMLIHPFDNSNCKMSCRSSYKCLYCYLINARSLLNKLPELYHFLNMVKPDILLITQSWLHQDISSGLLDPDSVYHVLRKDQGHHRGGGVCALVGRVLYVVQIDIVKVSQFLLCGVLFGSNSTGVQGAAAQRKFGDRYCRHS